MTDNTASVEGAPYLYDRSVEAELEALASRVRDLRSAGRLTPDTLRHIRRAFRVKNIYHSNAIEGNRLTIGETRQVVELGLTITGQSLKDQAEAKNLASALDFLEQLACVRYCQPDYRAFHQTTPRLCPTRHRRRQRW
jgi:Fic family protein